MTLAQDIMVRLHRRELTPAQAFAMQAARGAGMLDMPEPSARSLAPFANASTIPAEAAPSGIYAIWLAEVPKIRASSGLVRSLLKAHESTTETRSDLTECEKNARRRMILEYWYAEQNAGNDEAPKAVVQAVSMQDPRTGPGIPR